MAIPDQIFTFDPDTCRLHIFSHWYNCDFPNEPYTPETGPIHRFYRVCLICNYTQARIEHESP